MKVLVPLALACTLTATAQSTKSYDVTRSNLNAHETTLTAASVAAMPTAPKLIPVIGDPRGAEAQPLVDEAVPFAGGTRAVMAIASEANIVRGVDPDSTPIGAAIWQTPQLCTPIRTDSTVDMWGINYYIGMMSAGDADTVLHRLYQVATCSKDGSGKPASMEQRMFVLSMVDGSVIASTPLTGTSNGNDYTAAPRKQRSAILPWNFAGDRFKMVLSSSFSENGPLASGFLSAFDTYDNTFKAIESLGAGGWMSSQGCSMDEATGLIYCAMGNGPYDGKTKFGEAMLQIGFTPPTSTTVGRLAVLHSWALFSDNRRTCKEVYVGNKVAGESAPSSVPGASMPMVERCDPTWGDQDFGLFAKLLPDVHKFMAGGKDGIVAELDTQNFPDTLPADFLNPQANCSKAILSQPAWDLGMDSCPADPAKYNRFPGGATRHIHSTPATYIDENGNHFELFMGENSPLQAVLIHPDGTPEYIARGAEVASPQSPINAMQHGGMPGGFLSVTSNGRNDGIAWVSIPDGDANRTLTTGHLSAYDLRGLLALKGTGRMIPRIWVSDTYSYSKFSTPMIRNGHAYLPNYDGSVMVW